MMEENGQDPHTHILPGPDGTTTVPFDQAVKGPHGPGPSSAVGENRDGKEVDMWANQEDLNVEFILEAVDPSILKS